MTIRRLLIVTLSLVFALGWLQPNHYWPWKGFQNDAWAGVVFVALIPIALFARTQTWRVGWSSLFVLFVALVPAIQLQFGQIVNLGEAWMATIYLLGFLLTIWAGMCWSAISRFEPIEFILTSALAAAMLSVGLQLWQWLGLGEIGEFGMWLMGDGNGRPYANLGQPNLLATLILWGIVGTAWAYVRRVIGAAVALLLAVYLLFGLALTFSRTAWLCLTMIAVASWYWRSLWPNSKVSTSTTALLILFFVFTFSLESLGKLLDLASLRDLHEASNVGGDLRLHAWRVFIHGIFQSPWVGYGWNQVVAATFNQPVDGTALHGYFSHTHNLFLDLFVMMGLPLGIFAVSYLTYLAWQFTRNVKSAENALVWMALLAVGNHAMFEFPLHYAYFLLPTGLLIGTMSQMSNQPHTLRLKIAPWLLFLICGLMLAITIRDYLKVEDSIIEVRSEAVHIKLTKPVEPADTWVLSQWRDFVAMSILRVNGHESPSDLKWMRDLAIAVPAPVIFVDRAKALVLQNRPTEATDWLDTMCSISSMEVCLQVARHWQYLAEQQPTIPFPAWQPRAD